jgi:ketosteroid isomerase-like protein
MPNERDDFERFMKQRAVAAQAFVSGDAGPVTELASAQSTATFFGPRGGHTQGGREVSARYAHDAKAFSAGGESDLEVLHMDASDGMGFWVGFQRAKAKLQGQSEAVPMTLRITEIFRRESGAWKLVHRHADMLSEEKK